MENHNCDSEWTITYESIPNDPDCYFVVSTCNACGTKQYERCSGQMPTIEP